MSVTAKAAILHDIDTFLAESTQCLRTRDVAHLVSPMRLGMFIWDIFYILIQAVIVALFKPPPPKSPDHPLNPTGRIAVIGAGLTGVSSAAHAIAHNFDVVIYEARPRSGLGGIWAHVNRTSGLQLNSLLYRFHPAVIWSRAFPLRDEIVKQIESIWKEYHLEPRTRFDTPVTSVQRAPPPSPGSTNDDPDRSRWIINDGSDGVFDAVIVTVGTCGKPKWIELPGMPKDAGKSTDEKENNEKEDSSGVTQDSGDEKYKGGEKEEEGEEKETHTMSHDNHESKPKRRRGKKQGNKSHGHANHHDNDHDHNHDEDVFAKTIIHSSELDSSSFQLKGGERVVVIGSGASGVEAVETVLERFGSVVDFEGDKDTKGQRRKGVEVCMIARHDKWIIPRNIVIDTLLASQPFGREMPLSFIPEFFLKHWQYGGVEDLVPQETGLFESTPVVNDAFLQHVRTGRCSYIRGEPVRLTSSGVLVKPRKEKARHTSEKERGKDGKTVQDASHEELVEADVIVLATGFEKPKIDFLPDDLFPEGYQRPDLYLQNFSTEDWSILMTNSSYMNAIGTVGHFHIGIYTRILLTLLMDKSARPSPKDMKLWVDVLRFIKRGATGGAFGFFTYMELTIWLLGFHFLRPDRLRWLFFIMNGWGIYTKD